MIPKQCSRENKETREVGATFVACAAQLLSLECVKLFQLLLSLAVGYLLARQGLADEKVSEVRDSLNDRPNVVMILADDHCYRDFGFLGNDVVHTPNIDRLAAESARFINGYVPMSVCRPSLATLLTGLYPHQHGIHFNHPPPGLKQMRTVSAAQYQKLRSTTDSLILQVPTLPRILARHGYVCLQTGKHWEGSYRTAGFTHGMTLAKPAKRLGPVTGTREQDNGEWVAHGNGDAGLVIGRETMQPVDDFIVEHAGRKPFFVWYAPFLPHVPFDAPERFHRLYDGRNIERHLLPYYAEIARFDESVGHLIQLLKRTKQLNNTIVVFVSDNGFRPDKSRFEKYDRRSKLSQFEDGLRTPILIRFPGRTTTREHHQLVQTVDIVPTILSGVSLPNEITADMRGLDLWSAATAEVKLPDRPAFGAIYPNDAQQLGVPSIHVRARWIRYKHFKLILSGPARPAIGTALFNLNNDPQERRNLINDIAHADVVAEMTSMMNEWWTPEGSRQ